MFVCYLEMNPFYESFSEDKRLFKYLSRRRM